MRKVCIIIEAAIVTFHERVIYLISKFLLFQTQNTVPQVYAKHLNMGQEQSHVAHRGAQVRRYTDKIDDPIRYKSDYRADEQYRHKSRRSPDSNSDSSNESSGYRSGSSAYDFRSDRSSKSNYYCTSLYKNDHYKDVNKELYKPVKIPKEKRYKVRECN